MTVTASCPIFPPLVLPLKNYHWIELQNQNLPTAFHCFKSFLGLLLLWNKLQTPKHDILVSLSLSDKWSYSQHRWRAAFHFIHSLYCQYFGSLPPLLFSASSLLLFILSDQLYCGLPEIILGPCCKCCDSLSLGLPRGSSSIVCYDSHHRVVKC